MDWITRDQKSVWHPFTPTPHLGPKAMIVRGEGAYLYDSNGRRYFDATSSWWCQLHGHCHPRLVDAVKRQAAEMDQILFAPHTHRPAIELAETLLQMVGMPFQKVFYSDNGSTAVEAALKMMLQYWQLKGEKGRKRFVSLEGAYHGDTLGAVSVSHEGTFHHYFNDDNKALAVPVPRGEKDLQTAETILSEHRNEIAALIVEPLILGAGGMRMYSAWGMQELVRIAKRHQIPVIMDEVFTGFGRTGTMFAFQQMSERPDIVLLAKGLTSGMTTLAATLVTPKIYETFAAAPENTFFHGHTYTANPVGCAVALESMRMLHDKKSIERNEVLIQTFFEFCERFSLLKHVANVRQLGMVWAFDLVKDKETRATYSPKNGPGWRIADAMWERGVWIRPLHETIYVVPPYCTDVKELVSVLNSLYEVVKEECHYDHP